MMKKTVKKLWQGKYVSIRDYEAQKALTQGGMVIMHRGDRMTINTDNLKRIIEHGVKSKVFKSKTGGADYRLIDVTFKKDDNYDADQFDLL